MGTPQRVIREEDFSLHQNSDGVQTIVAFRILHAEGIWRCAQVIIAGAGGAAHLPGMVAALTPLPVIGVPVKPAGAHLDGLDALLSIVQVCHRLVGYVMCSSNIQYNRLHYLQQHREV